MSGLRCDVCGGRIVAKQLEEGIAVYDPEFGFIHTSCLMALRDGYDPQDDDEAVGF